MIDLEELAKCPVEEQLAFLALENERRHEEIQSLLRIVETLVEKLKS